MFEIVSRTKISEYNGTAVLYRDTETGMEAFHVENDSKELSCAFIFGTPSENSCGTAHILEHTVLCGSKRYPVKDPFSQISLSSVNTFLNAMTFCDKTMYPFSSPLKKDFDNIFDVYADAVFAPLLRRESFEQEGIRAFDHFDGVVFNEMTGDLSTEDAVVESCSARALFKGTPMEFESGGNPVDIADLKYEEYLAMYRKWYSPSNCRLFLYGNLDAYEYLRKIEERYLCDLSRWENKKITVYSNDYVRNLQPVRDIAYTSAQDAYSVVLTWLTVKSDDYDELFTASILVDILLGNQSSPLYRAITESGLGEDLSSVSGINTESPIVPFTVGFVGAKPGSEDKIEKFILSTLNRFATEGLDKDVVNAALKRQEFKVQEITGDSFPFGLGVCLKAARTWMRGGSPFDGIQECAKLARFKEKMKTPFYLENWIKTHLIENKTRCLLTVKTDSEYKKKIDRLLKDKFDLLHRKSGYDWNKLKSDYDAFIALEDSPEQLAAIPRLSLSDIPPYDISFETVRHDDKPYRLLSLTQVTRGIVYVNAAFNCVGLTLEEKKLLPLLIRLLQMCGTKKTDWVSFCTKMRLLTGSFSMSLNAGRGYLKDPVSNIIVRTKMLESDVAPALDHIKELLTSADLENAERIKAAATDIMTEFESSFIDAGSSYASLLSTSYLTVSSLENELFLGVSSYVYIRDLKRKYGKDMSVLGASLTSLANKIFTQNGLTLHLSCEKQEIEKNLVIAREFAQKLPVGDEINVSDFYKNFSSKFGTEKAVTVKGAPAYNAMSIKLHDLKQEDVADIILLSQILGGGCLWNSVRGQFGAYGVDCHVDNQEQLFLFSSYRDPMIENTFKEFEKCLEHKIGNNEKEYSIISIVGKELKPYAPWGKSSQSLRRVLYGLTDELYLKKRNRLMTVTCSELEKTASLVKSLIKSNCSKVTVCGSEMSSKLPKSFIKEDLGL